MIIDSIRRTSRLTLALAGLLVGAAASAADVQSQARALLAAHGATSSTPSAAAPSDREHSSHRPWGDAQAQAAVVLSARSRANAAAPRHGTRLALGLPQSSPPANPWRLSNTQEMARRVVLGIVD